MFIGRFFLSNSISVLLIMAHNNFYTILRSGKLVGAIVVTRYNDKRCHELKKQNSF